MRVRSCAGSAWTRNVVRWLWSCPQGCCRDRWCAGGHRTSRSVAGRIGHVFLKCCVNGVRQRAEHSALPVTPVEIATDVGRVLAAGADAVHVHPKDVDGRDTLDPHVVAQVVTETRALSPTVSIGMTTGAWIDPDPQRRVADIAAWTVRPDFASVNWHEAGAEDVAEALLDRGGRRRGRALARRSGAGLARVPAPLGVYAVLVELADGLDEVATVRRSGPDPQRAARRPRRARRRSCCTVRDSSAWPALRHAADARPAGQDRPRGRAHAAGRHACAGQRHAGDRCPTRRYRSYVTSR